MTDLMGDFNRSEKKKNIFKQMKKFLDFKKRLENDVILTIASILYFSIVMRYT